MFWVIFTLGAVIAFKLYQKFSCGICVADTILVGRVAIVTGANTGIGFETAKDFAKRGARVILACRDEQRGKNAAERIARDTGASPAAVVYRHLDLSSLTSIREFARRVIAEERRLDILINNAAVSGFNRRMTKDGIMVDIQVNHFGPFLLTNLLLPLLHKSEPSRIVNVSSIMHWFGKVDLNQIALPSKSGVLVYSNSKLCNVLFTKELSRRLRAAGWTVTVNSVHPGAVNTEIYRHMRSPFRQVINWLMGQVYKNCREGAQTSIHVAVAPETAEMSGKHFSDCRPTYTSAAARERTLARKLWELSEQLVKLTPEERLL